MLSDTVKARSSYDCLAIFEPNVEELIRREQALSEKKSLTFFCHFGIFLWQEEL